MDMRGFLSSLRAALPRIATLLFLVAGPVFADDIVFDPVTGLLTIPSVKVGGATYTNVTLVKSNDAYTFALQGAAAGSVVGTPLATSDVPNNLLTLPAVRLGQSTYRAQLDHIGNYNFNLRSAALVETYTFYSRFRPGVAQTATLVNGALFIDGIALTDFSFGDTATDPSDTLQSWTAPWNNSANQPTVKTMLFCAADGKLSYVLVKDAAKDSARTTATAVELVTAIHAAAPREGVGIYSDCSGQATKAWRNNLPADTFNLWPNTFTAYPYTTLLTQLEGAVIFRATGTPLTQHSFMGLTWKGTSTFEVWQ
jgi:hypothetical protein